MGAWLVREKGFAGEKLQAAVKEWLRFSHPDYYLAQAVRKLGEDPARYGLSAVGSCYQGRCEEPLRQGGCGGMGLRVKL